MMAVLPLMILALSASASALRTSPGTARPMTRRAAIVGAAASAISALASPAGAYNEPRLDQQEGIMYRARTKTLTTARVHERAKADNLVSSQLVASLDAGALQSLIDADMRALSEVQNELRDLMTGSAPSPEKNELEAYTVYTRIAKQVSRLRHELAARDDFFCGTL